MLALRWNKRNSLPRMVYAGHHSGSYHIGIQCISWWSMPCTVYSKESLVSMSTMSSTLPLHTSADAPDISPPAFAHGFQSPDHNMDNMSAREVKQVKDIQTLLIASVIDWHTEVVRKRRSTTI